MPLVDKWAQYEVASPSPAVKPDKWAQYVAPAAPSAPSTAPVLIPTGNLRALTPRERFMDPELYPVGLKDEGVGKNLHNLAQRAGVGMFQLANAAMTPRQSFASVLSSLLPDPVVRGVNRVVDLENKIPGAHYLTTKLPEGTPNPLEQAYQALATSRGPMEVAGKAAPVAGQMLATGGLGESGPAIVSDTLDAGYGGLRRVVGSGPGVANKLAREATESNRVIDLHNADKISDAQQKWQDAQAKANYDHRAELLKLRQQYDQTARDALDKARTGTAEDRAQYQSRQLAAKQKYDQSVRDTTEKFNNDRAEAQRANAAAQQQYNRRIGQRVRDNRAVGNAQTAQSARASQLQVGGSQIIYGLRQLDKTLRERANAMYGAVRDRMGDASLPSDVLAGIVKSAQEKWIRGSPEKVREFNAILAPSAHGPELTLADQTAQNMGYKDFRTAITNPAIRSTLSRALPPDVWQTAIGQGTMPVSWNDLQGFYEETGARIADGPQPGKGDVFKALQQAHDEIGNQMQKLADARGIGQDFRNARSFYRDYMQTFHTPSGPSSSGSVVAQVLRAKDPLIAAQKFGGASGERGIALLRQYDQNLANLAQDVQRTARGKISVPLGGKKSITDIPPPQIERVPTGSNLPLPPIQEPVPSPRASGLPLPPVLPDREVVPFRQPKLAPHLTISADDLQRANEAAVRARAQGLAGHLFWWTGIWPAFRMLSELSRGAEVSLKPLALMPAAGAAGMATEELMAQPAVVEFLTRATRRQVASIPPDLRGAMPEIVEQARAKGVRISPTLAAYATTIQNNQRAQKKQPEVVPSSTPTTAPVPAGATQ